MIAALLVAMLGGCAYNHLGGSVDLPLEFDQVRLRKQDQHLLIEYLRRQADGSTEKVVKLVVDTEGLSLPPPGDSLDLTDAQFDAHVTLARSTVEADRFPDITDGTLHFEVLEFVDNGHVDGEFVISFENLRNLEGWFDGYLEQL